jgi:hypothetical protein
VNFADILPGASIPHLYFFFIGKYLDKYRDLSVLCSINNSFSYITLPPFNSPQRGEKILTFKINVGKYHRFSPPLGEMSRSDRGGFCPLNKIFLIPILLFICYLKNILQKYE